MKSAPKREQRFTLPQEAGGPAIILHASCRRAVSEIEAPAYYLAHRIRAAHLDISINRCAFINERIDTAAVPPAPCDNREGIFLTNCSGTSRH